MSVIHQKYVHLRRLLVLFCFCIQIILQSMHSTHGYISQNLLHPCFWISRKLFQNCLVAAQEISRCLFFYLLVITESAASNDLFKEDQHTESLVTQKRTSDQQFRFTSESSFKDTHQSLVQQQLFQPKNQTTEFPTNSYSPKEMKLQHSQIAAIKQGSLLFF